MFYINDELLNYANNGKDKDGNFKFLDSNSANNPNCTWVAEGIEDIASRKMSVAIKIHDSLKTLNPAASETSRRKGAGDVYDYPQSVPLNVCVSIEKGGKIEIWRWSSAPKVTDPKTGKNEYFPHRFVDFGVVKNGIPPTKYHDPKKEAEWIWFLENVSDQKGKVFNFIDEVSDAKVTMEERKAQAVLDSILEGRADSIDDDIIPELAEAYLVPGVSDTFDRYSNREDAMIIVRSHLYKAVKDKLSNPRFRNAQKDFQALLTNGTQRKLRSSIQKAYEAGIIEQKQLPGQSISWFWNEGSKICDIKSNDYREELFQWFNRKAEDREKLFFELGDQGSVVDSIQDEYDKYGISDLQKMYLDKHPEGKKLPPGDHFRNNREWLISKIKDFALATV